MNVGWDWNWSSCGSGGTDQGHAVVYNSVHVLVW